MKTEGISLWLTLVSTVFLKAFSIFNHYDFLSNVMAIFADRWTSWILELYVSTSVPSASALEQMLSLCSLIHPLIQPCISCLLHGRHGVRLVEYCNDLCSIMVSKTFPLRVHDSEFWSQKPHLFNLFFCLNIFFFFHTKSFTFWLQSFFSASFPVTASYISDIWKPSTQSYLLLFKQILSPPCLCTVGPFPLRSILLHPKLSWLGQQLLFLQDLSAIFTFLRNSFLFARPGCFVLL